MAIIYAKGGEKLIYLSQWFSNVSMHPHFLGDSFNHRFQGPTHEFVMYKIRKLSQEFAVLQNSYMLLALLA